MESNTESVLRVLDECGVEYVREQGDRAKICCPFHDEKTPSMTIYDDNHCYCFGCDKHCWHDELIAKVANCSLVEAKKKLGTFDPDMEYVYTNKYPKNTRGLQIPNIDFADKPKDFSSVLSKLPEEIPPHMKQFLEEKGLYDFAYTTGLWRWHPKGTLRAWPKQEGICIPYFGPEGQISTFRLRRYDRMHEKFSHPLAPKGVPLQPSYLVFDRTKPVFFCEGESDSLSMRSIGRNVICLPGVGAKKQLHSAIMQCLNWQIPKLVFCGDNDEAGQIFNNYAIRVALTLGMSVFCPQLRTLPLPVEYNIRPDGMFKRKDINDYLVEGRLEGIMQEFDDFEERKPVTKAKNSDRIIDNISKIFGEVQEIEPEFEGGLF